MALVLGINAYHGDSSACIVRDGQLIAAAEEERFRRVKHWAGFPSEAIRYCLEEAGAQLDDVDDVAINRDTRANFLAKLRFLMSHRPDWRVLLNRLEKDRSITSVQQRLVSLSAGKPFRGRIHQVEHHLAHMASAFLVSPMDDAVVVSVDGSGDFATAAWGKGKGNDLSVDGKVFFPHSLGVFYEAVTQFLGFPNYGDEYKVMGLASYGSPNYLGEMCQLVHLEPDGTFRLNLDYFRHHRSETHYEWDGCAPSTSRLYEDSLQKLLGPARDAGADIEQRHMDIARSVQAMYERAFFHLLNVLHERYHTPNLVLAGGTAMNSVANGRIRANTPFSEIYIPAAAGDAGGALGAAFHVSRLLSPDGPRFVMNHAFWGPQYGAIDMDAAIEQRRRELDEGGCVAEQIASEEELCLRTATEIANGSVVGWFQGRMEWGPRALGNRSILCDPRRSDMKEILNAKIKKRESFRPFAPSILRDETAEWFEVEDDVPFMLKVFPIRESKRAQIPAVTHVDGTGRLQTVSNKANPLYHRLITDFFRLTGVPMVLNTSFNENEPVVNRPEEALDTFLRTKMDVLVLGSTLIYRKRVPVALTR